MKDKTYLIFGIVFIFLFYSVNFVTAQLPFQTSTSTIGIDVEFPKFETLKAGVDNRLTTQPYNKTDGRLLTNQTTECSLYAYYQNGTAAAQNKLNYSAEQKAFYIDIPAYVLVGGLGSYTIYCNTSYMGGFVSIPVEITNTGFLATTSDSIILVGSLLIMIILSILFVSLSWKVNNGTMILIFYSIAVILIFMASLFSMTLIDNLLSYKFGFSVDGYTAYIMVFKIMLSMSVLALVLYSGLQALKLWKMKRGMIDDD